MAGRERSDGTTDERPRALKSTFAGDVNLDLSKLVVDEITLVRSRCGNYPAGLRALFSRLIQVGELVDSTFSLGQGIETVERASDLGC